MRFTFTLRAKENNKIKYKIIEASSIGVAVMKACITNPELGKKFNIVSIRREHEDKNR